MQHTSTNVWNEKQVIRVGSLVGSFFEGSVEFFSHIAHTFMRSSRYQKLEGMFKKHVLAEAGSPSTKAAAMVTRGAYSQYVSKAQWRERRWRLFSTFPLMT